MKSNLIALIALLVFCALASRAFHESMPDQESPLRADEIVPTQQPREQQQTPLETLAPASAQELAYVVKIKDDKVEFQLTNLGSSVHHFYGDPLTLGYGDEVPSCAEIQVHQADGSLFQKWSSHFPPSDRWSPLVVSNTAKPFPGEPEVIEPGETRSLKVPLEDFFFGSDFDLKTRGCQVRVLSGLYLDSDFRQSIEARTDWTKLEF